MTDPHEMKIWTFHSLNSDPGKEWLAYLVLPSGRLPVSFFAASEQEAYDAAKFEWDKHSTEREENHRRREEGREKAAATRARKKAKEAA